MLFRDRIHAGKAIAQKLRAYADRSDVLVLGLARGGVPIAFEVAKELNAPLDVFLVRKLGLPGYEELAMGAIATGGVRILNQEVIDRNHITEQTIARVAAVEQRELERRELAYRGELPPLNLRDRIVLLVDDGLATGATMHVAAIALRAKEPKKIVAAVPVSAPETCDRFRMEVDEIVCAQTPDPFLAVGLWYDNFSQTTDEEVRELLARADRQQPAASGR